MFFQKRFSSLIFIVILNFYPVGSGLETLNQQQGLFQANVKYGRLEAIEVFCHRPLHNLGVFFGQFSHSFSRCYRKSGLCDYFFHFFLTGEMNKLPSPLPIVRVVSFKKPIAKLEFFKSEPKRSQNIKFKPLFDPEKEIAPGIISLMSREDKMRPGLQH